MKLSWGSMARTNRVVLATLGATAVLLALVPQTSDMLASISGNFSEALAFHVALWVMAFCAWHWSRAVLSARFKVEDTPQQRADLRSATNLEVDPTALNFVPRLIFCAAAAIGVIAALRSGRAAWWQAAIIIAWTAVSLVLLIARLPLQRRLFGKDDWTAGGERDRETGKRYTSPLQAERHGFLGSLRATIILLGDRAPFGRRIAYGLLLVAALLFVWGAVTTFVPALGMKLPRVIASVFTGPSAAMLSFGLAMGPLTALSFWTDRWHLPVLSRPPVFAALILVMLVVPAIFNLHQVRISPDDPKWRESERPALGKLFADWARACARGPGDIRPVILAISGGASGAGLWGARVIEAVEAADQGQNSGVFAVSSVSGGSLGTSFYFASLAGQADQRCKLDTAAKEARQKAITEALGRDALGPLLASALFGDVPRSTLGWIPALGAALAKTAPGWLRGGDRAEGLELAFEANWRVAQKANLKDVQNLISLGRNFLSLFTDGKGHARPGPIWIANGTDAQNGGRVLTAPFKTTMECAEAEPPPCGWPFRGALDALSLIGADIPISTAIGNTDRFAFLSPEGALTPVVPNPNEYPTQVIDGGYFDNSGAETALELAQWLETKGALRLEKEGVALAGRKVRPIIVEATTAFARKEKVDVVTCAPDRPDLPSISRGRQSLLQFFAPVGGIDAVRAGHQTTISRKIRDAYCAPDCRRFFHFYLFDNDSYTVPLNWTLSRTIVGHIWSDAMNDAGNPAEYGALTSVLAAAEPRACMDAARE